MNERLSSSRSRLQAMADVVVPPEVTAEVTQILSNLVLGDNGLKSRYVPPNLHLLAVLERVQVRSRPSTKVSHRLWRLLAIA